ncbi:MAG: MqnA/MqnD/SBP family protein [bacterium]|nr:MqnA/MqnD/SBP family protein [bacterium]
MEKIRVSNIESYTTLPYRLLSSLKFVEYRESSPVENARMLNEGEVDVALIPITEFAIHGGYVGLDFGIAGRSRIDAVVLFSKNPLKSLKTICLDNYSNSSVCLLRLLLKERWGLSPELVRVAHDTLLNQVGSEVAALVTGDMALNIRGKYPVEIDLAEEWFALTKLPFVFCVWATRPDTLSRELDQEINAVFNKAVKAREPLAVASREEIALPVIEASKHISDTVIYHLDKDCLAGMSEFYKRSFRLNLLPDEPYRTARYMMTSGEAATLKSPKSISSILEDSIAGKRISIAEATKLAEEAPLSDLAMASDMLRSKIFDKRSVSFALTISENEASDLKVLKEKISQISDTRAGSLTIKIAGAKLTNLVKYENLLHRLRQELLYPIEMFSVPDILWFSENSGMATREIASRLVTAGLDLMPETGGAMLIDKHLGKIVGAEYTASQWLSTMKWFHRFGAKSACSLAISTNQTWEERFLHLQKLRTLQDETPGFRFFSIQLATQKDPLLKAEIPLRALMISRLFLDNISQVDDVDLVKDPVSGMLNLSFGSNSARIDLSAHSPEETKKALDIIQALKDIGMDFEKVPGAANLNRPVLN